MDPDARKLAEEIEASRQEIAKLQDRVRQLVARRGKRAELAKSTHILPPQEFPEPAVVRPHQPKQPRATEDLARELTMEEGMHALKTTPFSEIRLIAFKHGAIIFLFANEKTLTVRMDDRGPKPLLDLLSANEKKASKVLPHAASLDTRSRA